ncbi:class I SAM-dependent methyltransferase [Pseudonocardia sp. GCM10023141]|uniref:class I SAM-dependent methyltransferase n=1 Tax=Pseudonocardia sp. GCM10023141 TaxID=3252653 RepID=UPI0036181FA0
MSDAARVRWDRRHAAVVDVAAMPPDALRGREALLPAGGRALDVACGRGGVSRWLAGHGFTVDAVDVSGAGLAAAAAAAGDAVRWWHHDLDLGLPPDCAGPYDVVVCQRFRDPALYPALRSALAPGGLLVITVLSEVGEEPGRFRAPAGELPAAFADLEVLAHTEGDGEASLVGRRRSPDA